MFITMTEHRYKTEMGNVLLYGVTVSLLSHKIQRSVSQFYILTLVLC